MKRLFTYLLLSATCLAQAQNSDKLTPELLWKMGRMSLEDISPNQKFVLYTLTTFDVEKNKGNADIYMLNLVDNMATQLTATEVSEGNARFTTDGERVGFIREGKLIEMNPSTKVENVVLDAEIGGFLYAPTGAGILTLQEVKYGKETKEIYPDYPQSKAKIITSLMYRHWKSWEDGYRGNIFVYPYNKGGKVNASEGVNIMPENYDAPLMPDGGVEQMAWSPDGKTIAYTCKKLVGTQAAISTNSDIYLYSFESHLTKNLSAENQGYDREPAFSPNGKYLLWQRMKTPGYEADQSRLIVCNLATGVKEELGVGYDNDVNDAKWAADNKTIFFIGGDKGTKPLFMVDIQDKRPVQLTRSQHDYAGFVIGEKELIAMRQSMAAPADLYSVDMKTGDALPITKVNEPILKNLKMGEVKGRWVKTTDKKEMLVWVVYPPDFDEKKKYPTLLYCQGGPQSPTSQFWSYRWNFQLMAANGYIVVIPCRRGMQTFGQAWNAQISKDWGGQAMKDYLTAIDEVSKEPYVNKNKLGAVGASFGGYSVYWLAGNHNHRFKAFISHCGLFNMESWYGTTEELFFANYDLGGAYWENPKNPSYNQFSPHRHVSKWNTPMLIFQGGLDFRVPESEGMQAFQAAQLKGIPSRLVLFPDEGHHISKPQNGLLWQKEFFLWLDTYLK